MTQQTRARRLTGTHLVLIVVALCAAAVLTPVTVEAAGIARYRLVDGNSSKAVDVSRAGRLQTDVRGPVSVTNPVSARYAAPPRSFSAMVGDGATIQQVAGGPGTVYVTSITVSNLSTQSQSGWIGKFASNCSEQLGYFYYARVPANDSVVSTFPTPLVVNQACARFQLQASQLTMVVTGYRP